MNDAMSDDVQLQSQEMMIQADAYRVPRCAAAAAVVHVGWPGEEMVLMVLLVVKLRHDE